MVLFMPFVRLGTQRVISFLRQLVEHSGFYRTSDQAWVKFERIQFVGACNPPTDPGRKPLSHRSVPSLLPAGCFNICLAHCNYRQTLNVFCLLKV